MPRVVLALLLLTLLVPRTALASALPAPASVASLRAAPSPEETTVGQPDDGPGDQPEPAAAPEAEPAAPLAEPAPSSDPPIDDRLAGPIHLLDDQTDRDGVPYPDAIRDLHVAIGLAGMAPGTLASYDRRARRITLTDRLLQEDPTAVATVLVHELVHVRDKDLIASGQARIDCLEQEVRAFETQSQIWRAFWADFPSRTPIERELTSAARIYEQRGTDGLREAIARVPTYQQQCPTAGG